MKYRKLRIAWSVTWGVVAVLLTALWTDSYWHATVLQKTSNGLTISIESTLGTASFTSSKLELAAAPWKAYRVRLTDLMRDATKGVEDNMHHFAGVHWAFLRNVTRVALSHWLMIAISVALAVMPWINSLKGRLHKN